MNFSDRLEIAIVEARGLTRNDVLNETWEFNTRDTATNFAEKMQNIFNVGFHVQGNLERNKYLITFMED